MNIAQWKVDSEMLALFTIAAKIQVRVSSPTCMLFAGMKRK